MSALIRGYFHVDPYAMDDDEFCRTWCELEYFLLWDKRTESR